MIDGIPHVRMNPPLRGRAELIRHISHSGKAPVPAIMYYQQSEDKPASFPENIRSRFHFCW